MKVPLRWLKEVVGIDCDTETLCERLTMGGLEVEAVEERGATLDGVVSAKVRSVKQHPDADRLRVCSVSIGEGDHLSIVCGAANVRRGMIVALAPGGATLPGGRVIEDSVIRGVASAGMLCSEAELGLAETSEGILELDKRTSLGADIGDLLGIRDTILELSITPNRGDCLSIVGLAREVALLGGGRIKVPLARLHESGEPSTSALRVKIEDASGCPRYAARIVRGVRVGHSPLWMQMRLQDAGVRPINNIVDVTNYVMLECGQPLHAFDMQRLKKAEIVVRRAGKGEAIQTLDGVVRKLETDDLVISAGDEAVAIAGVMGGADSEVRGDTTDVLLESAWFDPTSVRRTARRLDLHSEAAYRFERGTDIDAVPLALDRAAAMLAKHGGGKVAPGIVDGYPGRREMEAIVLRPQRVDAILGCEVGRDRVRRVMKALGARVEGASSRSLAVTPPTFRSDLQREVDLVEEVARIIGYSEIPTRLPSRPLQAGRVPERMRVEREIRRLLCSAGLSELVGLAFATRLANHVLPGVNTRGRAIRVLNPIANDEDEMRRSILHSVLAMWRYNRNQGADAIGGFSIGKAYWWDEGSREGWRLGECWHNRSRRPGLVCSDRRNSVMQRG